MQDRRFVIDDMGVDNSWRIFRIMAELVDGFETLSDIQPAVTVFGSSRCSENDPVYETARALGRLLAENGFSVITGGGPGVMEAANRGAGEAGGGVQTVPRRHGALPPVLLLHQVRLLYVGLPDLCRPSRCLQGSHASRAGS